MFFQICCISLLALVALEEQQIRLLALLILGATACVLLSVLHKILAQFIVFAMLIAVKQEQHQRQCLLAELVGTVELLQPLLICF
jgi:hypothetical protein